MKRGAPPRTYENHEPGSYLIEEAVLKVLHDETCSLGQIGGSLRASADGERVLDVGIVTQTLEQHLLA